MKIKYIVLLVVVLWSCKFNKRDNDQIVVSYYSNGNIKDSLNFTREGLKQGECYFYSENGGLDSIVMYSHGIRNGLKTEYLKDGIRVYGYYFNILVMEQEYDSTGALLYEGPLKVSSLPMTKYILSDSNLVFDQSKIDTIEFINPMLPVLNTEIEVQGADFVRFKNKNAGLLFISKANDSLKNIIIKLKISTEVGQKEPDRIDEIIVPIE